MSTIDPSATNAQEQDIEQQLDDLLTQLAAADPLAMAGLDQGDAPVGLPPVTESAIPDGADAPATGLAPQTPSDDELASQIQAMLDDARVAEAPPAGLSPRAADDAPTHAVKAPPPLAEAAKVEDTDVPIQAIDEMLAEAADDAVTGEFETLDQVLAAQQSSAPAPTEAVGPAVAPSASALTPPPSGDAHDDDAVEGHFETPEELLAASTNASAKVDAAETAQVASVLAGSAAAVAAELHDTKPAAAATAAKPLKAEKVRKVARPRIGPMIVICERGLRRALGAINRPLDAVSPATRSAIGWLGLATFFNGGAMLVYSMLHAM